MEITRFLYTTNPPIDAETAMTAATPTRIQNSQTSSTSVGMVIYVLERKQIEYPRCAGASQQE